jgi:hypothetical protein
MWCWRAKDTPASYHLAVVVDDALQGITLVTRGEDLLEATHLHRLLQELLGLPVPEWHHHRLITDETASDWPNGMMRARCAACVASGLDAGAGEGHAIVDQKTSGGGTICTPPAPSGLPFVSSISETTPSLKLTLSVPTSTFT